jgi:hypothetical protein
MTSEDGTHSSFRNVSKFTLHTVQKPQNQGTVKLPTNQQYK